jgi:hypothetical protein
MASVAYFIVGLALGYLVGSLLESVLHEYVSDAPQHYVVAWRRYPRLLRVLIKTNFSHHVVHHYLTFRTDHVTQFASDEERERLKKQLLARGRHGEIIIGDDYANRLHAEGGFVFALPAIVAGIVLSIFAPVSLAVGAVITLSLPTLFSHYMHPYLHKRFDDMVRSAPSVVAWILQTPYVKTMYVSHFMHHRYHGSSNYNLVLGADHIRGRMRKPSSEDIAAMRAIGTG